VRVPARRERSRVSTESDYVDYYFDDTDDDVVSDGEDYNTEMTEDDTSSGQEEQGRAKRRKMMTHGGRVIVG
jgi:hypothetical protein